MIQKEFLTLPIDDVIPYGNNPRINDSAVNDVVASIRQCENIDPIEVDENNVILSGHTRLKALKALEYTEVQVLRITGLTDEQKRKYRVLANKTAEKAEWDFEKLEVELDGLDFDGFDFGFDERFSIDDIEEVDGFNAEKDEREFFEKTFTFPIDKKKQIISYLKVHQNEIIDEIITKSGG